jgi:putative endonuclease
MVGRCGCADGQERGGEAGEVPMTFPRLMIERLGAMVSPARRNSPGHIDLGRRGETLAARYLEQERGYRLVATNFVTPLGRGVRGQKLSGEIDLVAYDDDTLVFVEVKTRMSDDMVSPVRAVDLRKQRQIARAARRYRRLMKVTAEPYRYDVVGVVMEKDGPRIVLLKGHFDDRVFQRGSYFRRDETSY